MFHDHGRLNKTQMPAELFPTRYRALSHGISAAFGKFGSVIAQLFLAYISYGHGINYNTIQKWLPYSLLIFSIFMLLGLLTTIAYIPADEHGPNGKVKTLEQWEIGRETPNGFAQTRLARVVEWCWRLLAKGWARVYLVVDHLAGGDERERREANKEEQRRRETDEADIPTPQNETAGDNHPPRGEVLGGNRSDL
jgi:PHS family inorganic phosphate transporter-like MFS transporter